MKKIIDKALYGMLLFAGLVMNAQVVPPPPPGEESGGIGAQPSSSPIDMYVVFLALAAIVFMIYFVKQNHKKTA